MSSYVIITPVKNEEGFIEKTITSMQDQTLQPVKWIIVNDGSTDRTREIIQKHMESYDRVMLVNRKQVVKERRRGHGVVEAFYAGYQQVRHEAFDYVVKLDGDLVLPPDFFEKIIDKFEKDPKLGIASGVSYAMKNGKWVRERAAKGYTYGETKVYRKNCFVDIGGLIPTMGWDGIDHIKAVMKGWKASSFEDIVFYHLRPEGTGTGKLKAAYEEGVCCHFMGYHPLFFLLRSFKWMITQHPRILGGMTMILSYLNCILLGKKRIDDPTFISFLRRNQIARLRSRSHQYTE